MKRKLAVEFAGDAWQKLFEDKYKKMRVRAWEATGSLITADGSEDSKISPQGVSNWPGPPPPGFAIPPDWLQPARQALAEEEEEEEEEDEEETFGYGHATVSLGLVFSLI